MPEGTVSLGGQRKRKVVAITLDDLIHEEAKIQAKKEGTNLSRMIELLLKKYLAEQHKKEEMRKREEELKTADKGSVLTEKFMRKLLFDEKYRSDEWIQVG